MRHHEFSLTRRDLFRGAAAVAAVGFFAPGAFAEQLALTPAVEEGPFYPHQLPLDIDNDLIIISDSVTPAVGQISHLTGRVLDAAGNPIKNADVEIWQCDSNGVYIASNDTQHADKNFQGFGRFTTGSTGEYRFRTIKPVPYSGRPAPHIHFKIKKSGRELFTTQMFVAGAPGNLRDGVYLGVRDPVDRELASAEFKPVKDSKINELSARFDLVLGRAPVD